MMAFERERYFSDATESFEGPNGRERTIFDANCWLA